MIANSEIGLEVELSTRCTIGCVACPRHRDKENKQIWDAGFIKLDTIFNILFLFLLSRLSNESIIVLNIYLSNFKIMFFIFIFNLLITKIIIFIIF